jgi:hypothetical protein
MPASCKNRLPLFVTLAAGAGLILHGPIAQLADYHAFADHRAWAGLPHAADVLSNLAFAAVGGWGLWRLWPARCDPAMAAAWPGCCLFLVALLMTAAGSAFYHWAPDDARLVFDRLPIALACAGLLAAVRADTAGRAEPPARRWVWLAVLSLAAVSSVLWWRASGDLRPYLLLQALPLVLLPLWQAVYDSARADRWAVAAACLLYVAAKGFELGDHAVWCATGWLGGHTLKHLLAAAAAAVLVSVWTRRRLARQPAGSLPVFTAN